MFPGCPRQIPQSRKTVVCVCVIAAFILCYFIFIVAFRCLESMISACGKDGNAYVDTELLHIISYALSSSNRFVRETTLSLVGTVVAAHADNGKFLMKVFFHLVIYVIIFIFGSR